MGCGGVRWGAGPGGKERLDWEKHLDLLDKEQGASGERCLSIFTSALLHQEYLRCYTNLIDVTLLACASFLLF